MQGVGTMRKNRSAAFRSVAAWLLGILLAALLVAACGAPAEDARQRAPPRRLRRHGPKKQPLPKNQRTEEATAARAEEATAEPAEEPLPSPAEEATAPAEGDRGRGGSHC